MAVRVGVILVAALLAVSTAGCLNPFRPLVDPDVVEASPQTWSITLDDEVSSGIFGPKVIETEYRFEPDGGPPFPAVLVVLGVRSFPRGDDGALLDRAREVVEVTLEEQGVTVDATQELRGERTLRNGAGTTWFRLVGSSQNDSPIFAAEEEIRVLGETWYDGRSETNVIAVALVQTTGTQGGPGSLFGQQVRDHAVWDELVGDLQGTIGGAIHDAGFIDHMVSHD